MLGQAKTRSNRTPSLAASALVGLLAIGLWVGPSATPGARLRQATPPPAVSLTAGTLYLPLVMRNAPGASEWSQFAGNAQHTSYTPNEVASPWRLKWIWNGPNASGGISTGKFGLPRNSQPITGGGRVYIAAGSRGLYALNSVTGAVVWNQNPGGNINSTPAYDSDTAALFVVSSNGTLYKLNAATGATLGEFATGSSSALPLPPTVVADRVFFAMGNQVFAVNKAALTQAWAYAAGSPVQTPPAYSPSRNRVIVVSQDLYVHAINNSNGSQAWKVRPTTRTGGDPASSNTTLAEASYGWPVIAEGHGYVLVKLRLDWNALWTWNPWPSDNATMRSNLQAQPAYRALFALDLDDGLIPFNINIGHGGFGDGGHLPMGPQPVIKTLPGGQELAYMVMRGSPCGALPCDGRWDSHLGELLLDDTTVAGYQAGDVRFMQNTFFPTDEQVNLSMAGDEIFGGHWMFGIAHRIGDRSASRGTGPNPITVSNLPHLITSASNCGFSASHYCPNALVQDGDSRTLPGGFYLYYNAGPVYNQYWSGYAAWVISPEALYYVSADGAVAAFESGPPTAMEPLGLAETEERPPMPTPDASAAIITLPYTLAHQYAGQLVSVEGRLKQVFNNGLAVYLGFKDPHQGAFAVRIMQSAWNNFEAAPETIYRPGQFVRVTGSITWYQGDPVIYVEQPSQIEVLK